MAERSRRAIGWVSAVGVAVVFSIAAFMLLGAAGPTDEVLQVDAAAWIGSTTTVSDIHSDTGIRPALLFLAVTSPTRGAVEQLQSGNVRVSDALRGYGGEYEDPGGPKTVEVVRFSNLGDGFYQIEVAPYYSWDPDQYVLRIEVECPWGKGIALCELPMGASDMTR